MKKIVPVARGLILCDHAISAERGKIDLYGVHEGFGAVQFPYEPPEFCGFARLCDGLGDAMTWIEVRDAGTDQCIFRSPGRLLRIPNRRTMHHVVYQIKGVVFPTPGVYIFELICDNQWVCDTVVQVRNRL